MLKRMLFVRTRRVRTRSRSSATWHDEIRFHVESRTADLIRGGLPPEEAARRARLEFGSIEKHKEESRASFGLRLLDEALGDARYALRTFAQKPDLHGDRHRDARARHWRQHRRFSACSMP